MIYFIQDELTLNIKIGFTNGDPEERLKALQTGSSGKLHLIGCLNGGIDVEKRAHSMFSHLRVMGEWFRPGPELLKIIIGDMVQAATGTAEQDGREQVYQKIRQYILGQCSDCGVRGEFLNEHGECQQCEKNKSQYFAAPPINLNGI